jgi:hypothetical protein
VMGENAQRNDCKRFTTALPGRKSFLCSDSPGCTRKSDRSRRMTK